MSAGGCCWHFFWLDGGLVLWELNCHFFCTELNFFFSSVIVHEVHVPMCSSGKWVWKTPNSCTIDYPVAVLCTVYGNPLYICYSTVPYIPLKDDSFQVNAVARLWCVVQPYGYWRLSLVAGLCSFQLARDGSSREAAHQTPGERATCLELMIPLANTQNGTDELCKSCLQPSPAAEMAVVSGLKGRKK